MIPALEDGVLPEGVHDCTVDELDEAFGRFQRSDRRMALVARLRQYLADARRSGVVAAVVIDGSFVTAKDEPEDVDLIVVLPPDLSPARVLRPFEYNAISKEAVKRVYHFDVYLAIEGSARYHEWLVFFGRVHPDKGGQYTTRSRKGILRVLT